MAKAKSNSKKITLEESLVPVEEQPYEVPENWCWVKHNSILDISGGSQPAKSHFITEPREGYTQLYQTRDYGEHPIPVYIPNKYATKTTCEGDILLARYGGSLGKVFRAHDGAYNVALAKVIKIYPELIDDEFLYKYYLSQFYQNFCIKASNGRSAQAGFNRDDMNSLPFPLPPLAEQKRIVDQIESLFAKLDEAKEKAQEALDAFANRKASILGKAMNGALTQNWRKDNGIDMDSWKETKFRDFCLLKRGYDLPTSQRSEGEYPLVTSSGINDYVSEFKVKGPGVITGRSGTIGKVYLVLEDFWPLNTTLYSEKLFANDAEFVFYYLQTFNFKEYSSSTAVPTLNRNLFLDKIILVPCINEQREIVRCINNLLGEEKETIASINKCIDNIDTMKKSILAKAFRGELGTNIETEESAIELLKSIL